MATIALQVVGNIIYPGIGGAIGAGVGAVIDTVVGSVLARKLVSQDAPIPDLPKNAGVDPGVPAPWVHGEGVRVPGTIIYASATRPFSIQEKQDKPITGYDYLVDVAIAWCRTPCAPDPVRKVWASSELLFAIEGDVSFELEYYGIRNEDVEMVFSSERIRVEDGLPWCDRDRWVKKRVVRRDQDMTWVVPKGGDRDQFLKSLKNQLPGQDVTISGCNEADNNGTFLLHTLDDGAFPDVNIGGVPHTVWSAIATRCAVQYPDDDPCEPDPTPCNPAVVEVIEEGDPANTITIEATLPGFSRYFAKIRNYTGSPDTVVTNFSRPNDVPDNRIQTDPDIDADTVPAFRGTCYTVLENLNITKWAGTLPQFEALIRERPISTPQTTIEALLARAEAEQPIEVDTEPLFDGSTRVRGIAVAGAAKPETQIRELMNLFDIESQEVQYTPPNAMLPVPQLKFSYRTDLDTTVIPYEDTSARESGSKGRVHAQLKRRTRDNLPQELTFEYADRSRDYQPSTSNYAIKTAPIMNRQKVATSISFSPEEADVITRKLLWRSINFADTFAFEMPPHYLEVVEGDRIAMTGLPDNSTLRGRITSITRGENGLLDVQGEIDDDSVYEQIPGGGYSLPEESVVELAPPGFPLMLDTAPQSSGDATRFGVYVALQLPLADLSFSYGIFASTDEVNWLEVARLSTAAVTGTATTVLAAPLDDSHWDEVSTVVISMKVNATLESLTRDEVSSGLNWAYLGGEVIGFTTVTLVQSATNPYKFDYQLSGLLRGRLDSATAIDTHAAGDVFVLLPPSGPGVAFAELEVERFQQRIYVRAVPDGDSVLSVASQTTQTEFIPQAATLRPYTVHNVWSIRRPDYSTCVFATERTRVPFRLLSSTVPPSVESTDATSFKADVYTLNDTLDDWIFRRQVTGCLCVRGQLCFQYSRAMIIEDLVNTGVIAQPEDIGETSFVIYRESETIGDGRPYSFCVEDVGVEFDGVCSIDPPA